LQEAHALFLRNGASIWAERAARELERLGTARESVLTETEREVARLAAQGLTNREVGARAFVTPKSVEGILSRVYAKLGIHSRAELGAWAAASRTVAESDGSVPTSPSRSD
jgi:DNA-binding CsgD family transcriptional regulator